ncbi:Protoporphyrinogen oxidase [Sesbania bispinosa]|nr:Protoporphyrinogen oxidase [Sesbania bispinosa]
MWRGTTIGMSSNQLMVHSEQIWSITEPVVANRGITTILVADHSHIIRADFPENHELVRAYQFAVHLRIGSLMGTHQFVNDGKLEGHNDTCRKRKRFGSIIAGALQSNLFAKRDKTGETKGALREKKHKGGSFSFQGGMQTLTDTLCKELDKDDLKLNAKVLTLAYSHDGSSSSQHWSITCASNQNTQVDAVIMTAPLCNLKDIKITIRGTPFALNFLPEVTYVPLSVIITTFRKENVKRPLEGFGVLVPSKEQQNGFKTLGTLFSSMMFPDRAPSDLHLYTTFIGGTRNRELTQASTDELKKIVTSDLRRLLGAEGEPTFVNHFCWSKGFPLYDRNYGSVLEAIDKMEKDLPGFFVAGNHKGGLSVGKAISSGCKAADLVISYLNNSSDNVVPDK